MRLVAICQKPPILSPSWSTMIMLHVKTDWLIGVYRQLKQYFSYIVVQHFKRYILVRTYLIVWCIYFTLVFILNIVLQENIAVSYNKNSRMKVKKVKMDIITIHVYHIFRLKYRCFVYALSMIVPSLYCLYPISYTQKNSKFHKISNIFKKNSKFKKLHKISK